MSSREWPLHLHLLGELHTYLQRALANSYLLLTFRGYEVYDMHVVAEMLHEQACTHTRTSATIH